MLNTPRCYLRKCRFYKGIFQPDGTELSERNVCKAFPDRIPREIAYGDNDHSKPIDGQGNDIVYEKGKFEWEE